MENGYNQVPDVFEYALYLIVAMMAVGFVVHEYDTHRALFNLPVMMFSKGVLEAVVRLSLPGHENAEHLLNVVDWAHPEKYGFTHMTALLDEADKYLRFALLPPAAGLIWYVTICPRPNIYKRKLDTWGLLERNARFIPAIVPIVKHKKKFGKTILDEPLDEGPWRSPRTPLQFAIEHQLILNEDGTPLTPKQVFDEYGFPDAENPCFDPDRNRGMRFDWKKAESVLATQLGPAFRSPFELPDYQKGLAAAFMAFVAGERKIGQRLLDQMSLSFEEPEPGPDMEKRMRIDISGADEIIKRYSGHRRVINAVRHHESFDYVYLMALCHRAIAILPSSQFIWLRPINETLWSALNQVGGSCFWVTALGTGMHFLIEETLNQPIYIAETKYAAANLEYELRRCGVLPWNGGKSPIETLKALGRL